MSLLRDYGERERIVISTREAMRVMFAPEGGSNMSSNFQRSILAQDGVGTVTKPAIGDRRRPAKDQSSSDPDLAPRGGFVPGTPDAVGAVPVASAAPIIPTAADMLGIIRIALAKMDPDEAGMLIEGLADLLSEEDSTANDQDLLNPVSRVPFTAPVIPAVPNKYNANYGVLNNNRSALDRSLRRCPAQVAALRSEVRALNSSGFQRRFGNLTSHIKLNSAGR